MYWKWIQKLGNVGAPVAYPLIQWHQGQKRSFLRLGEHIPKKSSVVDGSGRQRKDQWNGEKSWKDEQLPNVAS